MYNVSLAAICMASTHNLLQHYCYEIAAGDKYGIAIWNDFYNAPPGDDITS